MNCMFGNWDYSAKNSKKRTLVFFRIREMTEYILQNNDIFDLRKVFATTWQNKSLLNLENITLYYITIYYLYYFK